MGLPAPHPQHAARVYRLHKLSELLARYEPSDDAAPEGLAGYAGHQRHSIDTYIEVQLWSDQPVLAHLLT